MATIIREISIDVDPDVAWAALADFGRVDERLAAGFVTSCRLDGARVRTVTFLDGTVAQERLVGVDADARRLAYEVVESPLGLAHHNAAAQVVAEGDRSRFVWVTDVLPDDAAATIAGFMDLGIEAIRSTLEAAVLAE